MSEKLKELERCSNIESKGVQDIQDLFPMPVFEMTREPKCDRRKTGKEGE